MEVLEGTLESVFTDGTAFNSSLELATEVCRSEREGVSGTLAGQMDMFCECRCSVAVLNPRR